MAMWRKMILVLLLFPQWSVAEEIRFSYGVESFLWEEFDNSGNLLLDESGLRHLFALETENRFAPQWLSDLNAHITLATVAYDGENSDGDPVSTDTNYRGYGMEVGFNYFPKEVPVTGTTGAGVRLAFGVDAWDRNLLGAGGYSEHYITTYGRVAGVFMAPAAWRAEFGAKLPIVTLESIDLSAYGYVEEISLYPKGRPSLYASFFYRISERFGLKLAYDGYAFAQSDDDVVYNVDGNYYAIHQPKSAMHTLALAITLSL
jgi:hypothetical protein